MHISRIITEYTLAESSAYPRFGQPMSLTGLKLFSDAQYSNLPPLVSANIGER